MGGSGAQCDGDCHEGSIVNDPVSMLDGRVTMFPGDCLVVLATLPENSVDCVVCDPPYHLLTTVSRYAKTRLDGDGTNEKRAREGADCFGRSSKGFMGKAWDGGDVAFRPETWAAVLRVLKPGGHLCAFSATRTYHRMASAIEDAGFELRDMIAWLYGSGFPKSHDVSKGIDKALGRERAKVLIPAGQVRNPKTTGGGKDGAEGASRPFIVKAIEDGFHEAVSDEAVSDEAVSDEAVFWQGWGTALKPAIEPICLARKPLAAPSVAANVLKHGTGALHVDACKVEARKARKTATGGMSSKASPIFGAFNNGKAEPFETTLGRWPANVVHDGSDEVVEAFPDGVGNSARASTGGFDDSGSAARFFYSAKADGDDRLGSKHPTVKPVDLMRWLVRLTCPPGGVVLDPFAGTGTTGEAAWREDKRAWLIEREAEYQADIVKRMDLATASRQERLRAHGKGRAANDAGPLFTQDENGAT